MKTNAAHLIDTCGLSKKGAARLLDVRYDTVKNWYYGRCNTPEGVTRDLKAYAKAARDIFNLQH